MLRSQKRKINEIVWGLGRQYMYFPVLNCKVGDGAYMRLLNQLQCMQDNLQETDEINEVREKREILEIGRDKPNELRRDLQMHKRFFKMLNMLRGIDYSQVVLGQSESTSGLNSNGRFIGLDFQLADSHAHAYTLIKQAVLKSKSPVTIVRLDQHADTRKDFDTIVDKTNYLSQIVLDPMLSRRIETVLWAGKNLSGVRKRYEINGTPFVQCDIDDIPEVYNPAVIDIDLDVTENGGEMKEFFQGRSGGHIYAHSHYFNRGNIIYHPRAAARILRSQVKNPLSIGVALERGFRNRLFWYRVERDFLDELVK